MESPKNSMKRFWVELQPFLLSRGYRLRPRYDPNWKLLGSQKTGTFTQTGGPLLDGIRIHDNKRSFLKSSIFILPTLRADPRNHTVPILDVIPIPADDDWALLVMPMLLEFQQLPFRRLGEFCEAALQFLQGSHFALWFSHDGIAFQPFEWKERWSVRPVQYYLIDFGISLQLPDKDAGTIELSDTEWYDPFKVDVYQLGRVILEMIEEYDGLNKFLPLAKHMTSQNPEDRPSAAEAVKQCQKLISKLSPRALSRRIWMRSQNHVYGQMIDRFRIRFCGWNPIIF
ncbi:hypothetical protein BJ912DRAFT_1013485 [Pholiota molesta]|nr:hypothetical protein BJ912DRAFT_1013485 [Pholiota molesta]